MQVQQTCPACHPAAARSGQERLCRCRSADTTGTMQPFCFPASSALATLFQWFSRWAQGMEGVVWVAGSEEVEKTVSCCGCMQHAARRSMASVVESMLQQSSWLSRTCAGHGWALRP